MMPLPPNTDTNEIHIERSLLLLLEELAPGLRGYTLEHNGALYIPLLMADEPGSGACGAYLDQLPTDRTIKVPNVLSSVLVGMLMRRGFVVDHEWSAEHGETVEVWVRRAR